jgi:hypothetical protein
MADTHASVDDALLAVQKALPTVGKNNTADTGKYKYKYADLGAVHEAILPLLRENGLLWTAKPAVTEFGFALHFDMKHLESKTAISGDYWLPQSNNPQDMGSAITYARRYALVTVVGLVPDGDDKDGAAAPPPAVVSAETVAPPADWRKKVEAVNTINDLQSLYDNDARLWYTDEVRLAFKARRALIEAKA